MDHLEGVDLQRTDQVEFDRRVRLKFNSPQLSFNGSLLVMHELDDALGLSNLATPAQARFSSIDSIDCSGNRYSVVWLDTRISTTQTGRFETETLALP